MKFTQRIRSAINGLRGKGTADRDSELGADEVAREEMFPEKAENKKHGTPCKKPASKRTRPTNNSYTMIDPTDDTCDSSQS